MSAIYNTAARARCCAADLRFLLSILTDRLGRQREVQALIGQIENLPTDDQINAAWRLAAIIHDQIRQNNEND